MFSSVPKILTQKTDLTSTKIYTHTHTGFSGVIWGRPHLSITSFTTILSYSCISNRQGNFATAVYFVVLLSFVSISIPLFAHSLLLLSFCRIVYLYLTLSVFYISYLPSFCVSHVNSFLIIKYLPFRIYPIVTRSSLPLAKSSGVGKN